MPAEIMYPLGGGAIAATAVALLGFGLGASRPSYMLGLCSTLVAFLIAVTLHSIAHGHFVIPIWMVGPAIEEPIRVGVVVALHRRTPTLDTKSYLSFGFGYGLFECVLKLSDEWVRTSHVEAVDPWRLVASVATDVVPLSLHIFLTIVAVFLLRMKATVSAALTVCFFLHAAHNASVLLTPLPGDWLVLTGENFGRSGLFLSMAFALARYLKAESDVFLRK